MDVSSWLRELGLEDYAEAFRANHIDTDVLPQLTAEDLLALGITSIGHRRRLLEAIAKLRADTVPAGAEPLAPKRPAAAERRQLTVLFCDLVGSTELATRLDPEDLRAVMGAYHRCTAAVIERFDGHVAKYLGDGVLAYFGWPRAHEDDPERAVGAGLALVEAITRLEPEAGVRLQARIGIATGQVVVGDLVGAGASRDEAVVGEVPNLAARLQGLAAPGAVVISQATRRLVGGLFELDDLGPQRLKGFAEPLAAWRVAGEGSAEGRFEARQTTGLTPLVGRETELARLLRLWRQARAGEGQVVLLSGEPGIGKSRLVRELRERIAAERHIRLTHQCSSYHQTSPLHPIVEHLERAAGFARDDPPAARLAKLEALLARSTEKLDQAVPLLAALLDIPTGERYPPLDLSPQRRKQLTLEVLLDQLVALAAQQPVLMIHEDVHWVDPTTQELLGLTIERIAHLPALMIATFRPDFTPPWPPAPHVSTLALTRLGLDDRSAMVERMVGDKALPEEVTTQIVAKTDGVPLFVEELTKAVLESGLLKDAGDRYELSGPLPPLAIPASLHDSLMARLDRLAPVKGVAQIGAALGREFSHALLAAAADRPEAELHAALDQLLEAELIFRRGTPPETSYVFKHALVQDAAYGTLLKSRRQQLHARIAEVLEKQFPDTTESEPEVLAHHCIQAGLVEKAIHYWYNAARQAMARSAMVEAAAQLTKALGVLAGLPSGTDRDHKELDLQIALGAALIATRGWGEPEVERACARARELCAGEDQTPQLLAALYGLFLHHLHWSSKHVALQIAGELLRLAEREQDLGAQVVGHRCLGVSLLFNGQLLPALTHFKATLTLYDPTYRASPVYWMGPDTRVACLLFEALILLLQGYQNQALVRSREALAAAYELGHAYTTSQALYLTCWFHQIRGEQRAVEERAGTLIAYATQHGLSAWAADGTILHGWAMAVGGAADMGIAQLREGLVVKEAIGVLLHTPSVLGLLAGLYLRIKNPGEALKVLDEALTRVDRLEERWFEADLRRLKGEALLGLTHQRAAEAEVCYQQALAIARDQGARLWELRAAVSLARLWRARGRRADAHDLLAPIYGWFTEGFDTADLKSAKALLDEFR
jgi:class 3 adenylate cyclase/predicted ATPase